MIELASLQLQTPAWLALLPPLWILLWLFARHNGRHSMWDRVCDPHLLNNMRVVDSVDAPSTKLIWPLALVLTLSVLAASGPGWRAQSSPLMESANARIIALDLSQAMRVRDVKPDRFSQAIAAVREIIGSDFDGETGLVVYAGAAFVLSPLSRDANTLLAFIDALEPGMLPLEGARLNLAIERAQDLLLASVSGKGQIIVISSGSSEKSSAVRAALEARDRGHQVSILAIGTAAGGPLIDGDGMLLRDGGGKFILAKTDFDALESIAAAGGGIMLGISDAGAYDALLGSRISADILVEVSTASTDGINDIANEGYWLILLTLPFSLLLFRRNLLWIVLVAVVLPLEREAEAAESASIWRHREHQAYAFYRQGEFETSAALAQDPLLKGAAYYRVGNYHKALEIFSQANSAFAHYNRGNTLAKLDRSEEAITAYQQALALDPGLVDARYNKRLLEFYRQQQQVDDQQNSGSSSDSGQRHSAEQPKGEARPGVIGNETSNPADEQRLESGYGASVQLGQLDPFEQFDGREQQRDRFSLSNGINPIQAQILVESWVSKLPAASSELFRRKFIRDYQRQQQQTR